MITTATLLQTIRIKPVVTQWVLIILLSTILAVFIQVNDGTINLGTMPLLLKVITGVLMLGLVYHTAEKHAKMHRSLTILAGIIFFIAVIAISNSNPGLA